MKRLLTFCLGALAVSVSTASLAAKPTTLKFSNFAGPTSFITTEIFEPLVENIEADSEGTLKIQIYSGGTLVKPEDAFDAVRRGLVDMAWGLTGYNPGRFKAGSVTEIPFKANNVLEGSTGVWRLYESGLMDGFDDVYVFGLSSSAAGGMHSAKAIKSLDDLKGERVRAAGPYISASLEALGLNPVGIPASQVAENLSKRVVAGSINDWVALPTWQITDLVKHHIDVPLGAATAFVVINKRKYNALPEAAKKSLQANGGEAFVKFWSSRLEAENQRIRGEVLADSSQVLIAPTEQELQGYQDQIQGVLAKWMKDTPNGEKIWETYSSAIDEVRSQQ